MKTGVMQDIAAILWPTECVSCGFPDRDFCGACEQGLLRETGVLMVQNGGSATWLVAGVYDGALRDLIIGLKHGGRLKFARPLGVLLAEPLREIMRECRDTPAIVAVPSRKKRVQQRGYRHLDMIVREALRNIGLPRSLFAGQVLLAASGRSGQVGLDAAQRAANAAKIKIAKKKSRALTKKEIILIDDVITTGASVKAATEALEKAGLIVRGVVCLGVVQKRIQKARENKRV